MGLDACVHCNCIKKGKAPPHPYPELLVFDKTGEASLANCRERSLGEWKRHDAWYRNSCAHSGALIDKRIGNIALVAHVREFLETNSPGDFPLLRERVVHNDVHCGDWIAVGDAPESLQEARRLQAAATDPIILQFADDLIELAEASIATGNPIVF